MATSIDLAKEVRAALELDPRIGLHRFPIQVVNNGEGVRLEGEVDNIAAKRLARRLAQQASGRTPVIDALRLVPTEPRGDGEIGDGFERGLAAQRELQNCTVRRRIRGEVQTVREANDPDPCGDVEYTVAEGAITLDGSVLSLSHKRVMEAIAWWTPGCRDVINRLEVRPDEEDNDDEITDAVRLVLEMDPMVHADQIGIHSADGVVTLGGVLRQDAERRIAEMDAWAVCGVNEVRNEIQVQP